MNDMHHKMMRQTVALAAETMRAGRGGPFAAIIVRQGEIISEGYNQVTSANDPTAHAEVVAIRRACERLQTFSLTGCEIYASCEPCPMCLAAIYWARIEAVYFASSRTDAAAIGFDDDHIYGEVSRPIDQRAIPTRRVLIDEARQLFDEWHAKTDKIMY